MTVRSTLFDDEAKRMVVGFNGQAGAQLLANQNVIITQPAPLHAASGSIGATATTNLAVKVTHQFPLDFTDIGNALLQVFRISGSELPLVEIEHRLDRVLRGATVGCDTVYKL